MVLSRILVCSSKSLENLSFLFDELFLLLVLNLLVRRKLFTRTTALVVGVFCFTGAAGPSVNVGHEFGALGVVVVMLQQQLACFLVECGFGVRNNEQAFYCLKSKSRSHHPQGQQTVYFTHQQNMFNSKVWLPVFL